MVIQKVTKFVIHSVIHKGDKDDSKIVNNYHANPRSVTGKYYSANSLR